MSLALCFALRLSAARLGHSTGFFMLSSGALQGAAKISTLSPQPGLVAVPWHESKGAISKRAHLNSIERLRAGPLWYQQQNLSDRWSRHIASAARGATPGRFVCKECGARFPQPVGKCRNCGKFNTVVEGVAAVAEPSAKGSGGIVAAEEALRSRRTSASSSRGARGNRHRTAAPAAAGGLDLDDIANHTFPTDEFLQAEDTSSRRGPSRFAGVPQGFEYQSPTISSSSSSSSGVLGLGVQKRGWVREEGGPRYIGDINPNVSEHRLVLPGEAGEEVRHSREEM